MPKIDEGGFLDLVYGAAVESDRWLQAFQQFALLTGGWGAFVTRVNLVSGTSTELGACLDPDLAELYPGYYAALNPFAAVPRREGGMEHWRRRVFTDEAWLSNADLKRTEFYNDYLQPQGVLSAMMVHLADQPHVFSQLVVNRRVAATAEDLDCAARLRPHVQRAFGLAQRLSDLGMLDRDIDAALDASQHALFLLDSTGHVRRLNRKAETLLALRGGLYLKQGRLSALDTTSARHLDALIAVAQTGDVDQRRGGSMILQSAGHTSSMSLTVTPVRSERMAMLNNGPSVMVCVTDLNTRTSMTAPDLQLLFAVTPAEARVAIAVMTGGTGRQIAADLGLSFHTVRHHLQALLDKTGSASKADLVALLTRAAAGLSR